MSEIKNEESLSPEKAAKAAEKLEKQIQNETLKFNEKIKKLGDKAGLSLTTEVHIIIK